MCKRNSPDRNKASTGCVRQTAAIKNEISMGCVRETPQIKIKPVPDVKEKLPA